MELSHTLPTGIAPLANRAARTASFVAMAGRFADVPALRSWRQRCQGRDVDHIQPKNQSVVSYRT